MARASPCSRARARDASVRFATDDRGLERQTPDKLSFQPREGWRVHMPSDEIVEFYSNAEDCRRNALATGDEVAKIVWLQLAEDWQSLARTSSTISVH